jgi:hypothetical protein
LKGYFNTDFSGLNRKNTEIRFYESFRTFSVPSDIISCLTTNLSPNFHLA